MAATKFTAIYVNNEGKIVEREIPGMNTYKIALFCMCSYPESWKLYPKEDEKTEKN